MSRYLAVGLLLFIGPLCTSVNAQSVLSYIDFPTWPDAAVGTNRFWPAGGIAVNTATGRIYVPGSDATGHFHVAVVDEQSRSVELTELPTWQDIRVGTNRFMPAGVVCERAWCEGIVVNPSTNRIYLPGFDHTGNAYVGVLDGPTLTVSLTQLPTWPDPAVGRNSFIPLGDVAVDATRNRIYLPGRDHTGRFHLAVMNGDNNLINLVVMPTWFDERVGTNRFAPAGSLAVDPVANRVYLTGGDDTGGFYIAVFDGATERVTLNPMPSADWWRFRPHGLAVNAGTNRIYAFDSWDVAEFDGDTFEIIWLDLPMWDVPGFGMNRVNPTSIAVNTVTNRLYIPGRDWMGGRHLVSVDLVTRAVRLSLPGLEAFGAPAINTGTNRLYALTHDVAVIDLDTSVVSAGSNVTTIADSATITFESVTTSGEISVTPIRDPQSVAEVEGGFAVSTLAAYEISGSSSLEFSGPVTTCFQVPAVSDEEEFASLRVLHGEAGVLVDRTSSHDFSTRTICATTSSFSPFYIVRVGHRVNVLFDRTRVYRAGSSIPIRVQILDHSGANISSPSRVLTIRHLTAVRSGTVLPVSDSGRANEGGEFRYDATLDGYVFNLSAKSLVAGRYLLTFSDEEDPGLIFTVAFEIR